MYCFSLVAMTTNKYIMEIFLEKIKQDRRHEYSGDHIKYIQGLKVKIWASV